MLVYGTRTLCKTQDVSPSEAGAQATMVELKFQRGGTRWKQLTYSYNINLNFWLPKEQSGQSLYRTILVSH